MTVELKFALHDRQKTRFPGIQTFSKKTTFFRSTTMQFILPRLKQIGHQRMEFLTDMG